MCIMGQAMLKEFKSFIAKGNVMDLAVGIIIGAAFTAIVGSLVSDLINPIIGLIVGGVDFTNMYVVLSGTVPEGASLEAAREAGGRGLRLRGVHHRRDQLPDHCVCGLHAGQSGEKKSKQKNLRNLLRRRARQSWMSCWKSATR